MHSPPCSGGAIRMPKAPLAFDGPLPSRVSGGVHGGLLGVPPTPPTSQT